MMFKSTLLAVLAVAMGAYAQFALEIKSPADNSFVELGADHSVTIHADVPAGTAGPNIQLALCQIISGPSQPCNLTSGRVILNAPFTAPEQTYNVHVPADQAPGSTRLIVGHVDAAAVTATNETAITIFLGTR